MTDVCPRENDTVGCGLCGARPGEDYCPLVDESTKLLLERQDEALKMVPVEAVCSVNTPDCESCQ